MKNWAWVRGVAALESGVSVCCGAALLLFFLEECEAQVAVEAAGGSANELLGLYVGVKGGGKDDVFES